jgi:riboflavin biosynthesis pyrimidine reductase
MGISFAWDNQKKSMRKSKVICHMACSVNGKIISENWGNWRAKFGNLYEECHESFKSQAWMCGRVTLEKDFSDEERPRLKKSTQPVNRKPFIGNERAKSFAIAIDPGGKLGWKRNEINGDHIIEVLTEKVQGAYIHYLRQRKISYIFAGKSEISFTSALKQLSALFPIKTIMLEGGGLINGSMLEAGLIDELSLLLLPIADAKADTATVFELPDQRGNKKFSSYLRLKKIQKLKHQVLWLKYKVPK